MTNKDLKFTKEVLRQIYGGSISLELTNNHLLRGYRESKGEGDLFHISAYGAHYKAYLEVPRAVYEYNDCMVGGLLDDVVMESAIKAGLGK